MISTSNFSRKDTYKKYISTTHDGREFICETCSSKFKQNRLEMYIERVHKGKKLFKWYSYGYSCVKKSKIK